MSDSEHNPLYAGFGNKDTDVVSYSICGISKDHIYTIIPNGDIFLLNDPLTYSYTKLNELIDEFFPDFDPNQENNDFDDNNYWRNRRESCLSL